MKKHLKNHQGVPIEPDCVFTDEEDSCINSIQKAYTKCKTFRCDWHLQKNIEQHTSYPKNKVLKQHGLAIRRLFGSCKTQFNEDDFNRKWKELTNYIESIDVSSGNESLEQFKKAMNSYFLQELPRTCNRWADYFRNNVFHIGVKTTQSCECVNGILSKHGINGKSSVGAMIEDLFGIVEREKLENKLNDISVLSGHKLPEERKLNDTGKHLFKDLIDYCKRSLSAYATNEQIKQMNDSLMHKVIRWDNSSNDNSNDSATVYKALVHDNRGKSLEFDTTVTFQNGAMYTCSRCDCSIGLGIVCKVRFAQNAINILRIHK